MYVVYLDIPRPACSLFPGPSFSRELFAISTTSQPTPCNRAEQSSRALCPYNDSSVIASAAEAIGFGDESMDWTTKNCLFPGWQYLAHASPRVCMVREVGDRHHACRSASSIDKHLYRFVNLLCLAFMHITGFDSNPLSVLREANHLDHVRRCEAVCNEAER